jgi:hypothetical protein
VWLFYFVMYLRAKCQLLPVHTTWKGSDVISKALTLTFNWAPRIEGVLGSGGMGPRILDLRTRWKWVVSFTPRPLYPKGNSPWYSLHNKLSGPQSRAGRGDLEINSQPLLGLELLIIEPVAHLHTTEVSRLLASLLCVWILTQSYCDNYNPPEENYSL